MKIDIFTHVSPAKYNEALYKMCSPHPAVRDPSRQPASALSDPDVRIKLIGEFEDMMQVLTLGQPPIEQVADPQKAVELAKIANDSLAEFVAKYPDRFIATATLPMNNMDAALKELDRAINDLKFKGVQIYTNINGKPLDSPEFLPLHEKMSQYDLPIWIHPLKDVAEPDYPGEQGSKYNLAAIIGWPHATSMAMMRLAASGILERYPNLKFITHHSGGTMPYLANRIAGSPFKYGNLSRPITESLRLFYNDTAVQGNTSNLMCAYAFCGADHMLFATDFPMVSPDMIKQTMYSIEEMSITAVERQKIFVENARRLLKL
jgi:predicted TIM-barrel fold metal-dependent hydrolase